MTRIVWLLFVSATIANAASDGSGLQISASGDLNGQFGLRENSGATDKLEVREAEIHLYAPSDHLFDGTVSIVAENEGGVLEVKLHEAFVSSSKVIPRSRFRLGQFFLGIGRLNQFHRHEWPFTTAPKYHQDFFVTEEGLLDTGLEYSFLFPTPFFLELTLGLTNGFTFGHDHTAGKRPLFPTHYGRLATYLSLPWDGGTQVGLNYVGRRSGDSDRISLVGLDVTAKWREEKVAQFLFQSEVWLRLMTPNSSDPTSSLGFYLYPQYHLGSNFFAGVRMDYFSVLNLKDATGADFKSYELGVGPLIAYRPSEFTHFRLTYVYKPVYEVDRIVSDSKFIELQAVFMIGSHPAHDF